MATWPRVSVSSRTLAALSSGFRSANAGLRRDRVGRPRIVARQHHDVSDASGAECLDGATCVRPQIVADRDGRVHATLIADYDDGVALLLEAGDRAGKCVERRTEPTRK
jgi:hypothetical protein